MSDNAKYLKIAGQPDRLMVYESAAMHEVVGKALHAAAHSVPVLITGEPGTGKSNLARAMHANSGNQHSDQPFLSLNCSTLTPDQLSSELFGNGASKPGLLELAQEGTLALNAINQLTPEQQAKLLGALKDEEFTPIGATTPIAFKGRLIATTGTDINAQVEAGHFRKDLYQQLQGIQIPALRERAGDIPTLVEHFLNRSFRINSKKNPGFKRAEISTEALQALRAQPWENNVQGLWNAINWASIALQEPIIGLDGQPVKKTSSSGTPVITSEILGLGSVAPVAVAIQAPIPVTKPAVSAPAPQNTPIPSSNGDTHTPHTYPARDHMAAPAVAGIATSTQADGPAGEPTATIPPQTIPRNDVFEAKRQTLRGLFVRDGKQLTPSEVTELAVKYDSSKTLKTRVSLLLGNGSAQTIKTNGAMSPSIQAALHSVLTNDLKIGDTAGFESAWGDVQAQLPDGIKRPDASPQLAAHDDDNAAPLDIALFEANRKTLRGLFAMDGQVLTPPQIADLAKKYDDGKSLAMKIGLLFGNGSAHTIKNTSAMSKSMKAILLKVLTEDLKNQQGVETYERVWAALDGQLPERSRGSAAVERDDDRAANASPATGVKAGTLVSTAPIVTPTAGGTIDDNATNLSTDPVETQLEILRSVFVKDGARLTPDAVATLAQAHTQHRIEMRVNALWKNDDHDMIISFSSLQDMTINPLREVLVQDLKAPNEDIIKFNTAYQVLRTLLKVRVHGPAASETHSEDLPLVTRPEQDEAAARRSAIRAPRKGEPEPNRRIQAGGERHASTFLDDDTRPAAAPAEIKSIANMQEVNAQRAVVYSFFKYDNGQPISIRDIESGARLGVSFPLAGLFKGSDERPHESLLSRVVVDRLSEYLRRRNIDGYDDNQFRREFMELTRLSGRAAETASAAPAAPAAPAEPVRPAVMPTVQTILPSEPGLFAPQAQALYKFFIKGDSTPLSLEKIEQHTGVKMAALRALFVTGDPATLHSTGALREETLAELRNLLHRLSREDSISELNAAFHDLQRQHIAHAAVVSVPAHPDGDAPVSGNGDNHKVAPVPRPVIVVKNNRVEPVVHPQASNDISLNPPEDSRIMDADVPPFYRAAMPKLTHIQMNFPKLAEAVNARKATQVSADEVAQWLNNQGVPSSVATLNTLAYVLVIEGKGSFDDKMARYGDLMQRAANQDDLGNLIAPLMHERGLDAEGLGARMTEFLKPLPSPTNPTDVMRGALTAARGHNILLAMEQGERPLSTSEKFALYTSLCNTLHTMRTVSPLTSPERAAGGSSGG